MPPIPEHTYYDILGVPRTASQEEIKKRYRVLARQFHPDVNKHNPAASRIFSEITQAYKALSDADTRRSHDAELSLREQRAQQAASRFSAQNTGGTAASPPPNGAGAGTRPVPSARASAGASGNVAESLRLCQEGRAAFNRDRPIEARALAEQALRLNRRNAEAWELMGDAYRRQGRSDDAMNAYSMSLQINPRNASVMQRLERMARAAGPTVQRTYYDNTSVGGATGYDDSPKYGAGPGGAAGGGTYRPSATAGHVTRLDDRKRPLGLILTGLIGYGLVFFLMMYADLFPGEAPRNTTPLLAAVSTWNATITTIMALCGAILGATMTVTGAIRRIDDELILTGVGSRTGTYVPLGLIVIVVSVINFYFAALLYAIVTALQESFTQSMMRVFGAVVFVVVLLAVAYSPGAPVAHWQILLFGGNVVFITFVIGWLLGDFFRSDGL